MNILKKICLIFLMNLTALIACGGGGYFSTFVKDRSYNFLDPILINLEEENPLYNLSSTSRGYDSRIDYFKEKSKDLNVKEWQRYFENKLSKKEVNELFYAEHNSLNKSYNTIAKKLKHMAFEKYFNYMSDQVINAQGYDKPKISTEDLLKRGIQALLDEDDKFLKLRYLFLTMRLSHYSKNYEQVLELYKEHYAAVKNVDSIVFEWIDALRAGALQHLGENVASNLLYGKILKYNKTNAYLGYYDFKIENNAQWKNLLSQLKTDDEKALFYFLRALKWDGVPFLEHRKLVEIAPNSVWFERLSYMIMQDFQNQYLDEISIDKYDKYELANHKSYVEKKKYFLETLDMIKEPKFFSVYSKLYMEIKEQKDLKSFAKKFKKLYSLANEKQKIFVDILKYIHGVRLLSQTKKNDNKILFEELERLLKEAPISKRESLFAYTSHYMSKLYPSNSSEERFSKHCSVLKSTGYSSVSGHIDSISADDFERYVEKRNRSFYEKKVFKVVMSSLAKNDVAKFLTLLYTKDGNFEKANYYMKQVPKLNRKTEFNPFNVSLSGNNRKKKGKGYEQRKFVETMLKITKALEQNPSSAMDHYLYANGLYNSSWFGNFARAGSVERSVTHFSKAESKHILKNFDKIEEEYKLAEQYASTSEFKAKIAYQLLKVEYNRFIIQHESGRYGVYIWNFEPQNLVNSPKFTKAISEYKKSYGHTKYAKEIIKKCATFKYFR